MTTRLDAYDQLEALNHFLIRASSVLEKVEADSDASTAYAHERNAHIGLNEASRRLNHVLGNADNYPVTTASE